MIKTLTKHGNSYALIIDRPIMDLLKIEPDTPLEVTTDGKGLRVVPANNSLSEAEKEELHGILEEAYDQYGNALKNLAK